MQPEESSPTRTRYLIALCVVVGAGVFLRLPAPLFSGPMETLHLAPGYQHVGFDEGLYRNYVNDLIRGGITSYPDFAENYVQVQNTLPSAILPPTRFLYIFSSYVWHLLTGADALSSLHNISSVFSMLLLGLAAVFAVRLGGFRIGLCVTALMAFAPTQIHMSQHALIDGFFAFWATLALWLLWETTRRGSPASVSRSRSSSSRRRTQCLSTSVYLRCSASRRGSASARSARVCW